MGCIVNGPGEMADADFGYVGGAPGKVNLYVGKQAVKFNIPEGEAVARLTDLIREHGRWVDAPVVSLEGRVATGALLQAVRALSSGGRYVGSTALSLRRGPEGLVSKTTLESGVGELPSARSLSLRYRLSCRGKAAFSDIAENLGRLGGHPYLVTSMPQASRRRVTTGHGRRGRARGHGRTRREQRTHASSVNGRSSTKTRAPVPTTS